LIKVREDDEEDLLEAQAEDAALEREIERRRAKAEESCAEAKYGS
jgi:hypothetical protein